MKSITKFIAIAVIATLILPLSSCKRGANDPFLTLKSRLGRIAGTWKMGAADYTVKDIDGNVTTTTHYTFDGTHMKAVTETKIGSSTPTTSTNSETYSETWTFNKDNTFTGSITEGGFTITIEGNWAFLGKDEAAELDKKEAIILHTTKTTFGGSSTVYGNTDNPMTMVMDRLTGSEMIILSDEKTQESATEVNTTVGSKTYTK
jgi:hypothetical protein